MKKNRIFELILIILTIFVCYYLLKDNYKEIISSILEANFGWILFAIFLYLIYLLIQSIPLFNFTKLYNEKIRFKTMFYIIVVSNFFNGITPLATGGQPLQIYELHKKGIKTMDATNLVIQNSILYKIALISWSFIALLLNLIFNFHKMSSFLLLITIIGFFLNSLLLFGFILVSFSRTFNKNLIGFIIRFLSNLHIIKNKKKKEKEWNKKCDDFYINSKILLKNHKMFIKSILVLFVGITIYYTIPYFIALALNCHQELNILLVMVISNYVYLASSYLPIPGTAGGIEYAFIENFKLYIVDYKLNALLILWRFLTYYLPTMLGGLAFNINNINKKE
jgi:uncharacterized protein (TIRG00374 family)